MKMSDISTSFSSDVSSLYLPTFFFLFFVFYSFFHAKVFIISVRQKWSIQGGSSTCLYYVQKCSNCIIYSGVWSSNTKKKTGGKTEKDISEFSRLYNKFESSTRTM